MLFDNMELKEEKRRRRYSSGCLGLTGFRDMGASLCFGDWLVLGGVMGIRCRYVYLFEVHLATAVRLWLVLDFRQDE